MRSGMDRLVLSRQGGVMVELGLTIPLLFIFCMAAGDFARIFFHALTAQGSAAQAAFYGSQTTGQSGDFAGMQQLVADDEGPLGAPTVDASQWCGCYDGSTIDCSQYSVSTCPGYGDPLAYVRVEVTDPFNTMGPYPLIPQTSTVRQFAWMRVR